MAHVFQDTTLGVPIIDRVQTMVTPKSGYRIRTVSPYRKNGKPQGFLLRVIRLDAHTMGRVDSGVNLTHSAILWLFISVSRQSESQSAMGKS